MTAHRWHILALIVPCLALGASGSAPIGAAAEDVLPEDSLWVGKIDQHRKGPNGIMDAVLWIQSRKGPEFTGVMWYPKIEVAKELSTALFKVGGRLDGKSNITLDVYSVLAAGGGTWNTAKSSGSISKKELTTEIKDDKDNVVLDIKLKYTKY